MKAFEKIVKIIKMIVKFIEKNETWDRNYQHKLDGWEC